jgi:TFIIB zinc-binding.
VSSQTVSLRCPECGDTFEFPETDADVTHVTCDLCGHVLTANNSITEDFSV